MQVVPGSVVRLVMLLVLFGLKYGRLAILGQMLVFFLASVLSLSLVRVKGRCFRGKKPDHMSGFYQNISSSGWLVPRSCLPAGGPGDEL